MMVEKKKATTKKTETKKQETKKVAPVKQEVKKQAPAPAAKAVAAPGATTTQDATHRCLHLPLWYQHRRVNGYPRQCRTMQKPSRM